MSNGNLIEKGRFIRSFFYDYALYHFSQDKADHSAMKHHLKLKSLRIIIYNIIV
jgi:hypothetical protein